MIEVRIHSLNVDADTNQPVIILRDAESGKLLPIWIGHNEATAILLKLQRVEPPRPLTHDLLFNAIRDMGFVLQRVEITRLEESTFYASLVLRGEEKTIAVDARPSDSIALAVRAHAPIFVAEDVIEEAGLIPDEEYDEEAEVERFRDFLENVNPQDFMPPQ
ncbi:MAG TPA: bifunctional nuclease family protein [Coriobacteriia bacterium]